MHYIFQVNAWHIEMFVFVFVDDFMTILMADWVIDIYKMSVPGRFPDVLEALAIK